MKILTGARRWEGPREQWAEAAWEKKQAKNRNKFLTHGRILESMLAQCAFREAVIKLSEASRDCSFRKQN